VTKRPIYLDYQATTPADPAVVAAMTPYFHERFGNPHSVHHAYGRAAAEAVEEARAKIAALINAEPREIVFTSGATEANNLAIKGVARFHLAYGRGTPHVITCATEHKCVLESARRLEREGVRVTYLPVGAGGLLDLGTLEAALTPETVLVSVMAVNNEIGVIQPFAEIGALCRDRKVAFHSDVAQAFGKIPLAVEAAKVDLLSISGHKVYGPMGIGALYVRRRPRVRLEPLMDGGGQERGFRSGTLPLPLCVGLGMAAAVAGEVMAEEAERLGQLRRLLLDTIRSRLTGVSVNGDPEARIPGNLNLGFEGLSAEALIAAMPGLAVSTGSACTSASVEPSYVLRALGLPDELAGASVRFGIGRFTTEVEIRAAAEQVVEAVERLRASGTQAAE
jgi:cysteine desulfurase